MTPLALAAFALALAGQRPSTRPVFAEADGRTLAVVVPARPLLHTAQAFAPDAGGAAAQARRVIEQLQATVKAAGGGRLVKLNLYAASQEAADAAAAEVRRAWTSAA